MPTPLHLFLGISNRIILDAFSELLGKELVEETLKTVTTVHSAGCGGKSDLYRSQRARDRKWIKKECSATLRTAAAAVASLTAASEVFPFHPLPLAAAAASLSCFTKTTGQQQDIDAWRAAVNDIQQHWSCGDSSGCIPEAAHAAHTHWSSLSAIDSSVEHQRHRSSPSMLSFNALFHKQHLNSQATQMRAPAPLLADATLRAVQPFLSAMLNFYFF